MLKGDALGFKQSKIKVYEVFYGMEQESFYNIIKQYSKTTDLTLVEIPNYKIEKQAEFILKTNDLFEVFGSTLLVKASNNFNVLDLNFVSET